VYEKKMSVRVEEGDGVIPKTVGAKVLAHAVQYPVMSIALFMKISSAADTLFYAILSSRAPALATDETDPAKICQASHVRRRVGQTASILGDKPRAKGVRDVDRVERVRRVAGGLDRLADFWPT
jgi:hypothetical protein